MKNMMKVTRNLTVHLLSTVRTTVPRLWGHRKQLVFAMLGGILAFVIFILPFINPNKIVREEPCHGHPVANTEDHLLMDKMAVEAGLDEYLVPNYVHFYRFGPAASELSLTDVLCLLSAFHVQQPDRIFIHTDNVQATVDSFDKSRYGQWLLKVPGFEKVLYIQEYSQPKHVFGIPFTAKYKDWHISDIARLRILRKYGGIFLDNDAYLVRNVNHLRKKELSIGVSFESGMIENTILISHRDSQVLKMVLTSFMYYSPGVPSHYSSKQVADIFYSTNTNINIVDNCILKSSVKHLMSDNIPDFSENNQIHVLNLNTKPRDGIQDKGINYTTEFADDILEKYFSLNKYIRRRVRAVSKMLFEGLEP